MVLEEAIKQASFANNSMKLLLNILYTQSKLASYSITILKPFDISPQQFNILRILRGQKDQAVSLHDISERMIDRNSNTSRLVEKLRHKGLVVRELCPADRRRAEIRITDEGLALVAKASEVMETKMVETLSILSDSETDQVNQLLDKLNHNFQLLN